jgi:glucosamine--fructose-6-phosphate aminotransferase (isomerizing)
MNPYLANIHEQPDAVRTAVTEFDSAALAGMRGASFERIVVCGMGGSHFAGYPAWLNLTRAGLPAWHVEASELLHQAAEIINRKTLLILISQSGRSAEVLSLLDKVVPGQVLAITNDATSPLAECANAVLQLHAGEESAVSTKTFLNTVAVTQLAARILAGQPIGVQQGELFKAADAIEQYLSAFDEHRARVEDSIGVPERLIVLGRGASLAAACTGALVLKEASKLHAEGMSAGQFRHGPLELADTRLTVLALKGEGQTQELNSRLIVDLQRYGTRAHLIGADTAVAHPVAAGAGLPLVEILPLQMLSIVVAEGTGFVPGKFRHSQKVTVAE